MHLPHIVAMGAALTVTSSLAAPLTSAAGSSASGSNEKPLTPMSYRATAGGMFGSMVPQALFAAHQPTNEKLNKRGLIPPSSTAHSIQRRKPSNGLQVVLNYVNRLTRSNESENDEEDEDDDDDEEDEEEEEDGTDPSHYYQPIGKRGNSQQPFSAGGKRAANIQCGVPGTTTTSSAVQTPTSAVSTPTTASSAPSSTSTSAVPAQGKNGGGLVTGYWPEWASGTLPPENIAWSKYDYVYYAFGIPTSSGSITLDDTSLLKRFVTAAHKGNSKALLSIGGWGQSNGFSASVASDASRANFITNVLKVISTYNLDGVDFDWEYPGNVQGGPSNPKDTGNFQTFLQQLRAKFPAGKIMTAAVPQQVWQGSNGNPVGSVARAGGALDHIVIMNYDVWGSSNTPGPNAPLANLCGNSTQPTASAAGGVKAWTSAGFPRSKILLGVPAYGYLNPSSRNYLIQRGLPDREEEGGVILTADRPDIRKQKHNKRTTLTSSDNSHTEGQINFNTLVSQGALQVNSQTGNYDATGGFTKYWDDCSDTPYLANGKIVVTYDDPDSLYDKADFAKLAGIAGISMWSIDGDTSDNALITALAAGLSP